MRILYVEDNPVDIDLLARHLQKKAPHIRMDAVRTQKEALAIGSGGCTGTKLWWIERFLRMAGTQEVQDARADFFRSISELSTLRNL